MARPRCSALLLFLGLSTAPACLSPGPPLAVRTFEPAGEPAPAHGAPATAELMLAAVRARPHLDLPMLWRVSPVELRRVESARWMASPAGLVEDRLREALFVAGPFRPAFGSQAAPRLSVEVVAFEGLEGSTPLAKVALLAERLGVDGVSEVRRFHALEELDAVSGEALATGIGRALDRVIADLVAWNAASTADS